MKSSSAHELGESLHRTIKLAIDEGEVPSLEAAQQLFESYRLRVRVGANIASSSTRQAILLTVVNTAARCFLGGVEVELGEDAPLRVRHRHCKTVTEAIDDLGAQICPQLSSGNGPLLLIGDCPNVRGDGVLRLSFDGWCAAVSPTEDEPLLENRECPLAGVLVGALGVSEAFQFVRGKNIEAGLRRVALSLWKPELDPFLNLDSRGPDILYLPASAWVIGLGHLGQAYLWTLGMLPYANPQEVQIVLQDTDRLQESNLSTSVLTSDAVLGQMKTRAMAAWCEQRGFKVRIHERLFTSDFHIQPHEPKVALCGVDNSLARACLEDVGFEEVIEAGLGSQGEDYLRLRLHGFADGAGSRKARSIWGNLATDFSDEQIRLQGPVYRDLEARGLDICGLTTLAGRAVGASFVGVVTATFCIAEMVRMTMGADRYAQLEVSLRNPELVTMRSLSVPRNRTVSWTLAS